jgi:hypothetical protein
LRFANDFVLVEFEVPKWLNTDFIMSAKDWNFDDMFISFMELFDIGLERYDVRILITFWMFIVGKQCVKLKSIFEVTWRKIKFID